MTINIFGLKGDLNGEIVVVRFFFCRVYNTLSFRSSKMSKLLSGRFSVFSVRSKGSGEVVYTFAQARLIHRYLTIV